MRRPTFMEGFTDTEIVLFWVLPGLGVALVIGLIAIYQCIRLSLGLGVAAFFGTVIWLIVMLSYTMVMTTILSLPLFQTRKKKRTEENVSPSKATERDAIITDVNTCLCISEKIIETEEYDRHCREAQEAHDLYLKRRDETIMEYLKTVLPPLLPEDEVVYLIGQLQAFIKDPGYTPEGIGWHWKTRVTSFDVRYLIWNITIRLGQGKNGYSGMTCAIFLQRLFTDLCGGISIDALRNLTQKGTWYAIRRDIPDSKESFEFHLD